MSRIGGRNVVFAWVVGVLCTAVIVTLGILTVPLVTSGLGMLSPAPAESGSTDAAADGPTQCRDLYTEPMWAALQYTPGAEIVSSTDQPVSTAVEFVQALAPQVRFTCTWTSESGTISTTVATVGTDAGSIAASALPPAGFSCTDNGDRVRCSRADGELIETIEAGAGIWVSTSQTGWHPERYAGRVADAAFAER